MQAGPTTWRSLDYDSCTVAELKRFCIQRGVNLGAGRVRDWRKKIYVEALEQEDESETFDFLGLPKELRIMIYELLLVRDNPKKVLPTSQIDDLGPQLRNIPELKCHPQILAMSRFIHAEADAVFTSKNTLTLAFRSYIKTAKLRERCEEASLGGTWRDERHPQLMTLDHMKAVFPGQRVAKFSNVRIAVAVCTRSEHCVGLIMALRCMCAISWIKTRSNTCF